MVALYAGNAYDRRRGAIECAIIPASRSSTNLRKRKRRSNEKERGRWKREIGIHLVLQVLRSCFAAIVPIRALYASTRCRLILQPLLRFCDCKKLSLLSPLLKASRAHREATISSQIFVSRHVSRWEIVREITSRLYVRTRRVIKKRFACFNSCLARRT